MSFLGFGPTKERKGSGLEIAGANLGPCSDPSEARSIYRGGNDQVPGAVKRVNHADD